MKFSWDQVRREQQALSPACPVASCPEKIWFYSKQGDCRMITILSKQKKSNSPTPRFIHPALYRKGKYTLFSFRETETSILKPTTNRENTNSVHSKCKPPWPSLFCHVCIEREKVKEGCRMSERSERHVLMTFKPWLGLLLYGRTAEVRMPSALCLPFCSEASL